MKAASAPKTAARKLANQIWMNQDYQKNPDKYRERSRNWVANNREETNAKRKAWARENPERTMLLNAKHRAKKKGIPFEISLSDIQIPNQCPITLMPLVLGEGKIKLNSPTLDRIDITKGYVPGNVAVISNRANYNKGDFSIEEIERLYNYSKGITYNY